MIEKAAGWIAPRHGADTQRADEAFVLVADTSSPRVGRIGVLNGLRGVAILAVIYHHYFAGLTPPGWLTIYLGSLPVFVGTHLSNGWLGVNLFFVLSGFVLYLPYASGRRRIEGSGDIRAFYMHRARRLLPLYAISTLIFEMVVVRPDYGSLSCLKYYAVMITGTFPFFPGTFYPRMNLVLWTLGLEIWFSILFPFLLMTIDRFGLRRTVTVTLALSLLTRFVGIGESFRVPHYTVNYVKDSILGRLDDFVLGMAACARSSSGASHRIGRVPAWLAAGLAMLTLGCWAWDGSRLELISRVVGAPAQQSYQCRGVLTRARPALRRPRIRPHPSSRVPPSRSPA